MNQTLYIAGDATRIYKVALCNYVSRALSQGYSVAVSDAALSPEQLFMRPAGPLFSADYKYRNKISVRLKWSVTDAGFIVYVQGLPHKDQIEVIEIAGFSMGAIARPIWSLFKPPMDIDFHYAVSEAIGVILLKAPTYAQVKRACRAEYGHWASPHFQSIREGWSFIGNDGEDLALKGFTL